jgi:hypothetical protein
MKKCSLSLAIKEMQIKTILRFPFKTPPPINAGKEAGKNKPSYSAGGNVS